MRFLCFLLVSGMLVSTAAAQPPLTPQPMPSALQHIREVHQWSDDKLAVSLVVEQIVYETIQKEVEAIVIENGVQVKVKRTVNEAVAVMKKVVIQYALKDIKATDVEGKALTPDEVFKRLPPGSAVLVFAEGYRMPASHKRLFSKEAVILVLPAPPTIKKEPR